MKIAALLFPCAALMACLASAQAEQPLEEAWQNPPTEARLRAYWWWLNGNVTKESITRDLEQMKAKGFGGAVLIDAGGADQDGNAPVPHGPTFFTPAWRELYKHALREASRLGLEISLNIQSGWNLGAPGVSASEAVKQYVWTETDLAGGARVEKELPQPRERDQFYRDTFVVAYPLKTGGRESEPLKNWRQKALQSSLQPFSAPDSSPLFAEIPATPGEEDTRAGAVVDLTAKLGQDGTLRWDAPPGKWRVLRFGYTVGDHGYVSTASEGWRGYALDVYDEGAFQLYWNAVVEPLIADAGPPAARSLKYLHTDSWEIELANWTPGLRDEFRGRRGYDMLPWLPALAGWIVNSRDQSDRFLADYRKTLGDLAIDHHYRLFRDNAHRDGLLIHPEAGGPHAVPIDAQRCLGWDDAPMSEFWAWSWEHRIGDENRFFVKQPASAAHTYGHRLVLAEGFTEIGLHWQESLWGNLKPSFDKAVCEGLNDLVWHAFVCSPDETGIPGQQYFAGTHLNPKVTWWGKSQAFFSYIDRCQSLLQRGLPFADVLYYYGDNVPNFAQLKKSDPAKILPGYDYDVISEEALLERVSARDGQIILPDGMSYQVLVLPERKSLSLAVLQKAKELVAAGATVIGPKPSEASGLGDYPKCDQTLHELADALYGGRGIITNQTARQALLQKGFAPDFTWAPASGNSGKPDIDYIHRTDAGTEIYFVMNRASNAVALDCSFRVKGLAPELWDAVSGEHHFAAAYAERDGRVTLPLHFNPCGSIFVLFREDAAKHPASSSRNWPDLDPIQELAGPWDVAFDPRWGGPASARFDRLESWTSRAEPGIRYYSGAAVYRKSFSLRKAPASKVILDLGQVRELAEVKVNGRSCGIAWTPPFRADITAALKPGGNALEIEVVNFWPNRLIGDQFLPPAERLTKTNIRKFTQHTPLMESGLLGPVRLLSEK
ncbi:MAG TPA: glycosyl hydrolase [Verrucomicrobiae bacterium]